MTELDVLMHSGVFKKVGAVCIQESWLTSKIDSALISINGFTSHRVDRTAMKGGGVVTYVSDAWIKSTDQVYEYSANLIDCLALKCTPKYNYLGKSLIIVNVYIPQVTTNRALTETFDSLIAHVGPLLVNN